MSIHQVLARTVQLRGNEAAVSHQGFTVSWRAFENRVARRGAQLQHLGIEEGERVAVLAANVPEHMEALFAPSCARLIVVPINTRLTESEQIYILQHAQCKVLMHDARHADRAARLSRAVAGLNTLALGEIASWGTESDTLCQHSPLPFRCAKSDDVAAIFYTGGTTGVPKGVALSHTALMLQGMSARETYGLGADTVYMHTAPMFHLADFAAAMGVTFAGGRHHFLPDFAPGVILDAIQKDGVNIIVVVPTMVSAMLDAAATQPGSLSGLHTMLYGAAPIQGPLLLRLLREAPGVGLFQVYGQTEVGGASTTLAPKYHVLDGPNAGKLDSAGQAVPLFLIRIVDQEGRDMPLGEVGEICIAGPGVMTGYWNQPELTAQTLRDGWVHTGDLGFLDGEGFVTIAGRLKDMIISGGENVFAGEVESALMQHADVDSAAVLGIPDEKWGESVHAAVVLKKAASVDEATLIAHCRSLIAAYKCPRTIEIRDEPLPLSGVGKIRKVEIRDAWIERTKKAGV
jgi:long-chain acyl-CoA synthetase